MSHSMSHVAVKSSSDRIIDGDLAALGDTSRQHVPSLDESLAATAVHRPRTPNTSAYRDDLPGAEARRNALAETRRRELALMPLTMSQIYAHRVGRAVAGAGAILCALGLLVVLDDTFLVRLTAYFIPGFALGVYALASIAFVLTTYVVAHRIAEHRFTVRMRELVTTGPDAYVDLDQLAVGPFAVAAAAVRRVDRVSLVLPLVGTALLAPLLAFVGYIGLLAVKPHTGRSTIAMFLEMTNEMAPVLVALAAGVVLASVLGHVLRRDESPTLVRWLGHWGVLIVALVLGLGTAIAATKVAFDTSLPPSLLVSADARYVLSLCGEAAILLPTTWLVLWSRRREQARLGD